MWSLELSMKTLFAAIVLLACCAQAQHESIEKYANRLQNIIVSGDTKGFVDLPCFPSNCIDQETTDYIFGEGGGDGFVKRLLSQSNIEIKIFGPYRYSSLPNRTEYAIMYYDPRLVKFNDSGYLSPDGRENLWWRGYVETVVTLDSGKWAFHRTPFYYGAHLPWTEDY